MSISPEFYNLEIMVEGLADYYYKHGSYSELVELVGCLKALEDRVADYRESKLDQED